ncbi:MAG: M56 family metallopeptidase [Planctomycetaceae bacterium]|nr:M56 family metallopeptidase [Planctomycetaceae bacterium]
MSGVLQGLDDCLERLMNASWQGAALALIVTVITWLYPALRPRWQVWLWRLVVLKFCVAFIWTAPLELPLLTPAANAIATGSTAMPNAVTNEIVTTTAQSQTLSLLGLSVAMVWLTGVAWQTLRGIVAARELRDLRRQCQPCQDVEWRSLLGDVSRALGLRRTPALLETAGEGSPLLCGVFRPAIIIPRQAGERLTSAERRLVMQHELAHALHHDIAWNLLAALTRTWFWFHPLIWFVERRLRLTQELAADARAIEVADRDPVRYAAQLVSLVAKLGPQPPIPALCAGATGSSFSLQQRLTAMRFFACPARRGALQCTLLAASVALAVLVPWKLVAADPATPANANRPTEVMTKSGRGRFVSYTDGKLTLLGNSGSLLVWESLPSGITAVQFNHAEKKFAPVADAAAALAQAKPGMWVQVFLDKGTASLRIDERKGSTVGTFVSYKDQRLLILGKNLGASFTKKYGNQLHFNKFAPGVPVHESVDGGPYKLIGTAEQVLGNVAEGTIVTVHAEGDDNITLIQLGVAKTNE